LLDYGTVKLGSYLYSADVLDKMNLFAGAAVNSKFDYDLYGSVEYREIWPIVFLEVFNMSANISDTANVVRSNEGDKRFVRLEQDINFDLTEARLGIRGSVPKIWSWKFEYIFSYYNAKVDTKEKLDPIENVLYGGTVRYPYLIGHALQWSIIADAISGGMHKDINPSGGFYLNLKHGLENNRLIEGFKTDQGEIKKVYNSYNYNRLELQAEYFIMNPLLKSHALSFRLTGGYIDRNVDDFFNFFAGGLLGMKGYSFYSIEGRQKLITTLTYRMPVFKHIDRRIGHIYLDKLYFGIFYDYGHAWNQESIPWKSFQRDIGLQLRLETFSYHLFPTRLFAEAAYPLDEVTNVNTFYEKEWRFYFGALFEYDFRERLGTLSKLNPMRIFNQ
jgi:outer membrane protein assembly factor BamA